MCGYKLLDTEDPEPRINVPYSWPVGGIIQVGEKYNLLIDFTTEPVIQEIPKNFCIELVE